MSNDFFVETGFLAKYLDTTDDKIYHLVKKGLPVVDKRYPFLECVIWYVRYLREQLADTESEKAKENLRLVRAKAENAELENQRLKNRLLDAEQIKQQIIMLMQVLKDSLLSLPGGLCNDLANKEAKDIRDRLDIEIKTALNKAGERIDNEICTANNIGSCLERVEDTGI